VKSTFFLDSSFNWECRKQVAVPQAVIAELLHEDAPEEVRKLASNLPSWMSTAAIPGVVSGGLEKLRPSRLTLFSSTKGGAPCRCGTRTPR
jgi:hypothetical protein